MSDMTQFAKALLAENSMLEWSEPRLGRRPNRRRCFAMVTLRMTAKDCVRYQREFGSYLSETNLLLDFIAIHFATAPKGTTP